MASQRITVRLSDEEKSILEERSATLGMNTSSYIRFLLSLPNPIILDPTDEEYVDKCISSKPKELGGSVLISIVDRATFFKIVREITRQGNNLNQAASALNLLARLVREGRDTRMDWNVMLASSQRMVREAKEELAKISEYCGSVAKAGRMVEGERVTKAESTANPAGIAKS